MQRINIISADIRQTFSFITEDGNKIDFYLEYKPQQLGWFVSFTYQNYEFNNIRLSTNYNIIRRCRNYLPFGIRIDTVDGYEPLSQEDFSSGYANMYILDKTEVFAIEELIYAK